MSTVKRVLPPIDAFYWLTILAATALGEKLGDLVSMTFALGYGASAILLVSLAWPFRVPPSAPSCAGSVSPG